MRGCGEIMRHAARLRGGNDAMLQYVAGVY
jgi:hypothetical protein